MGETIIGLQAGTNKCATASGINFGTQRHVGDMKSGEANRAASSIISLQMGSNKFATQSGMNFGAQRHIGDIKCEGPSREGSAVIGLQIGTNKFASQSGMVFGAQRHVGDLKIESMATLPRSATGNIRSTTSSGRSSRSREDTPKRNSGYSGQTNSSHPLPPQLENLDNSNATSDF